MMFSAVTGPMPSISSSWSTVALPSDTGPSAEAPAAAAPRAWHDDLLAVAEARREIDSVLGRAGGEAAGPLHRVGDPGPRGKPVDAGTPDRPRHVDDDVAGRVSAGLEAFGREGRLRAAASSSPDRTKRAPTSRTATATAA